MVESVIFEELRQILSEQLHVEGTKVRPEALLAQDLGADSLDTAEISMLISEKFSCELPDDRIFRIKTVADLVAEIVAAQQKLNQDVH